ncbi:MFS transporter [Modestobacter versicolor]|uniref:MFS transporter n=1 Tax=Modestobacter versicolor TaxID=429133 RepID=A0A323V9B4_9ACTN|nr:MFS transporter [Modestobacter versicolor]
MLSTGALMMIVDETIVNVALPSIQQDLGIAAHDLSWVVNAYLIAFGGLLLLAGRLGDAFGRARVFRAGLALFTLASLACALADDAGTLVAARFVQGAGGALTSASVLSLIVGLFPDPAQRARALGVYGFVTAAGASLGLLLGGVLTQALSWHWVFLVNVPLGVSVGVAAARLVPRDRPSAHAGRPDVLGAVLVTGGLMLLVGTIVVSGDTGWTTRSLLTGAAGLLALSGFVLRQQHATAPLLPLALLRSRVLSGGGAVIALFVAGMFTQFFLGALYLQQVLGFRPGQVGLGFLPVAVSIGVLSLVASPVLIRRVGPRAVLLPSLAAVVLGLGLLARVPVDGAYARDVLPALLLLGAATGLAFPALMGLTMSGSAPEDAGLASGVVTTAQQAGGALGLAVTSAVAAATTSAALREGSPALTALTEGYRTAFGVAALAVTLALLLALVVFRPRLTPAGPTAPRAAAQPPS